MFHILPPKGSSDEYLDESYEEDFIVFIEENDEKLFKHDMRSFSLFIEVYYIDQCNFELLNNSRL
ncbi:hypothetical protein F945_02633 [Acinetobacter rudis CIP 110305]|uniref:Uncharacterized protein n=1 Tax=Acinetobacter rudis CIP 110305 TaxID=421052 RepID=S3MV13_9GAMM|nr:hypothetical protein F945_02633 [Acinetobacter rudis CIP 110305]